MSAWGKERSLPSQQAPRVVWPWDDRGRTALADKEAVWKGIYKLRALIADMRREGLDVRDLVSPVCL